MPQINDELKKSNWSYDSPLPGIEIVSWYVMMGIDQMVTLRVPADQPAMLAR